MNGNDEIKRDTGFIYILNLLSPLTPFGREAVKRLKPFGQENKEQLCQELDEIEKIIRTGEECKCDSKQLEHLLRSIKDIRGSLTRMTETCLQDIELFEIRQFLITMEEVIVVFNSWNQRVQLTTISLLDVKEALDILDPQGNRFPGFYIYESYSDSLRNIRYEKKQIEGKLRNSPDKEITDQLKKDRRSLILQEEEEEKRIRGVLTEKLRCYEALIKSAIISIERLDLILQKAYVATKYKSVKPVITKEKLSLTEAVNPEVVDILKEKGNMFKPITMEIVSGVTVITGANMGGKSVALRTIALNIILAQYGFYVYGEAAEIPLFDYMHIITSEYESIKDGLSSFGGEIFKINQALGSLGKGYGFFLVDELAGGTNPREGAAIVKAVVKFLNSQNAITLLATHYDNVAEHGKFHYQVRGLRNMNIEDSNQNFAKDIYNKGVSAIAELMDYGIDPVSAYEETPKDAVNICRLLGLNPDIMGIMEQFLQ